MKQILRLAFFSSIILSACTHQKPQDESQLRSFILTPIDSIQIPYLGNPNLQDISPSNEKVLFIESGPNDEEIFTADFNGEILNSFVTNGNTIVGHLRRIAPLHFEEDGNSFLSVGQPQVKRVSIDGTKVEILLTGIPPYYSGFPSPTNELFFNEKKIFFNNRSEISEYNRYQKEYLQNLKLLGQLDLEKNEIKYFLPFPESSIYHNGLIFPHSSWVSHFIFSQNQLIVAFEGEPALYIFDGKEPFSFRQKIDLNLGDFRAYKGNPEGEEGIDIMEAMITLGKIESIKKMGKYILIGYNHGFTDDQLRIWKNASTPEETRELINKFKNDNPTRILLMNENLEFLDDFPNPQFLNISSLMARDGYLWGSKYAPNIEEDYFTIYKLEIQEK